MEVTLSVNGPPVNSAVWKRTFVPLLSTDKAWIAAVVKSKFAVYVPARLNVA